MKRDHNMEFVRTKLTIKSVLCANITWPDKNSARLKIPANAAKNVFQEPLSIFKKHTTTITDFHIYSSLEIGHKVNLNFIVDHVFCYTVY